MKVGLKLWLLWALTLRLFAVEDLQGNLPARFLVGIPKSVLLEPLDQRQIQDFYHHHESLREYAWTILQRINNPIPITKKLHLPWWMTLYAESEHRSLFQSAKILRHDAEAFHRDRMLSVSDWDPATLSFWIDEVSASPYRLRGIFGLNQTWLTADVLLGAFDSSKELWSCQNHSSRYQCLSEGLSPSAIAIKTVWHPIDRPVPTFRTGPSDIHSRLRRSGSWDEPDGRSHLSSTNSFVAELHDGAQYGIVGLHVAAKVSEHWLWITLWWSDEPEKDFGADRPESMEAEWKNYKMCAILGGPQADHQMCSNPYIEKGSNNADTNCSGCHQHAGAGLSQSTILQDVKLRKWHHRTSFPTDYVWILAQRTKRWLRAVLEE